MAAIYNRVEKIDTHNWQSSQIATWRHMSNIRLCLDDYDNIALTADVDALL